MGYKPYYMSMETTLALTTITTQNMHIFAMATWTSIFHLPTSMLIRKY